MPDVLSPLQILLPDMPGHGFRVLLVLRASFPHRALLTLVAFTLVFPISFAVGGGITQNLVLWTQDTVVIFIVYILIPRQVPFLRHWPLVGERWYPSTVKDLFADPWRFVARIRCDHLDFWIMYPQTFKYRVERNAVVYVSGGYLRLQYIPASVTYRMRLVRKAFPVLSLVKQSALRVSAGSNDCLFLPWCTGPVFAVIVLLLILLQRFLSMRCAIRFDFLIQLLLIPFRRHGYGLFHLLLQIRVRFDVCPIHEHNFRRQISRMGDFFQYPPEHAFDHFACESVPEGVADRRKVRQFL